MKYTDSNKPLVCMQTQSACYNGTKEMAVKGVLWHCTGAANPNLMRYIQPSDIKPSADTYSKAKWLELLGTNINKNDLNHNTERQIGLNCWIGKLADAEGTVTTVQTLPWNYRPWGCGGGLIGSCNDGWIQFEICEDNLVDADYFNEVYKEACEITAYLCKMYNINPKGKVAFKGIQIPTILCHQDAYKLKMASNHADIYNWFPKFGKNMDNVRADVAALLKGADFELSPDDTTGDSGSDSGSSDSGDSSTTTSVSQTEPVKPIEPTLIKKVSVSETSFDYVKIRLKTSSFFNTYLWTYSVTCLQTGESSKNPQTIEIKDTKQDFTISGLIPNYNYLLTITATEIIEKKSNGVHVMGDSVVVPDFAFKTKQYYPKAVKNISFTITGNNLSKAKCHISFTPPESWGSFDSDIVQKGYRVSLFINSYEKGYNDSLISADSSSIELNLLSGLLDTFKVKSLLPDDTIQIGVLPWVINKEENKIFAKTEAKCSKPIQLGYAANIHPIRNFYFKTTKNFKRIALFNFSK